MHVLSPRNVVLALFLLLPVLALSQSSYNIYFGDFHAHTWYSDGNQDQNMSTYTVPVARAITYARTVGGANMNFLGISDHNHNEGGLHMTLDHWRSGFREADSVNQDGSFAGMFGQEWGVISNGGHVCIYGTDKLFGWDAGVYDVYIPKSNYSVLWDSVAKYGGFCYLAHPQTGDYGNIFATAYNAKADSIISGVAVKSGPATSTNTTETNPASGNYESKYHDLLRIGYHVAPCAHQDNHNTTYGMVNQQRTGVIAASLTRANILDALRNRHAYCSEDHNLQLRFESGSHIQGDIFQTGDSTRLRVKVTDPDAGETVTSIEIRYGVPGSGTAPTALTSISGKDSLIYALKPATGSTYYYYAYVTMSNGLHAWSAPVWVTQVTSQPPLAFNLLSPAAGATNRPLADTLSWQASTYATGYDVLLDGNNPPTTVVSTNQAGTSFVYGGLSANRTYYWKVTAKNSSGSIVATGSPRSFSTVVPAFSVSPAGIAFGSVAVGAGKTDSVTVSSAGGATLTIDSVRSDNARFTVTPGTASIAAGATKKYFFTFTPTVAAAQSGNIRFYHNAAGSPSTVTVSGTGNQLQIAATTHTGGTIAPAGAINVNYGASQAFTVASNAGYHIDSLLVDGTNVGARASYIFSNITVNHTISPYFSVNRYSITASAGANGAIAPPGSQTVNYGDSAMYTITPAGGYDISDVVVDGQSVGAVASYTFRNISANHTILASFSIPGYYTVTATSGPNGSIIPLGAVSVPAGESVSFSIAPATGYHIDSVKVDGSYIGADTAYTFTNITANHTIQATFRINTYTISVTSGSGGTVSPSGTFTVSYGMDTTIRFTPSAGFVVDSVIVDGAYAGAPASYTFSAVSASHTLAVKFKLLVYTIMASVTGNGTITPSGAVIVRAGIDTTFTYAPGGDSHLLALLVDSVAVVPERDYTFFGVDRNHTITAQFAVNVYTITATAGSHGTIAPAGTLSINQGSDTTFTFTPETGYQVASVLIDGVSQGAVPSYTFHGLVANHTISVTFSPNEYALEITVAGGGTITRSPDTDTYPFGSSVQLTAAANSGYVFSGWSGDLTSIDNPLAVTVHGPIHLVATFTGIPVFQASRSGVAFDTVLIGETCRDSFIIRNAGGAPLTIASVTTGTGNFTVSQVAAPIAPADSEVVYVTFKPGSEGAFSDNISIVHDGTGSPMSIDLSGTGRYFRVDVPLAAQWNLVSNPLNALDASVAALYPSRLLPYAFSFGPGGYQQEAQLENGKGYWEKFAGEQTATIPGFPVACDTFYLNAGWNLIGSISYPVQFSTLAPRGGANFQSVLYGYSQGYTPADVIVPGKAYWIKVDHAGSLILNKASGALSMAKALPVASAFAAMNTVIIKDAGGNVQTLYFGHAAAGLGPTELPPRPPAGIFDARFASQRIAEEIAADTKLPQQFRIDLSSAKYPVTVSLCAAGDAPKQLLITNLAGEALLSVKGGRQGSATIADKKITALMLSIPATPKEYALYQNYPNPFNPASIIQFELPVQSRVMVKVYDILGRETRTLINNETQEAGFHQVSFDGSNLASGVYFYRLEATALDGTQKTFNQIKKMLLVR